MVSYGFIVVRRDFVHPQYGEREMHPPQLELVLRPSGLLEPSGVPKGTPASLQGVPDAGRVLSERWPWLKPMGSHFGVAAPPILEPILVVGLVDVHWGYDLDFDPWPDQTSPKTRALRGQKKRNIHRTRLKLLKGLDFGCSSPAIPCIDLRLKGFGIGGIQHVSQGRREDPTPNPNAVSFFRHILRRHTNGISFFRHIFAKTHPHTHTHLHLLLLGGSARGHAPGLACSSAVTEKKGFCAPLLILKRIDFTTGNNCQHVFPMHEKAHGGKWLFH